MHHNIASNHWRNNRLCNNNNNNLCNLKFRRDCLRFEAVCFIDSQTEGHMKAGSVECDWRVQIQVLVMFIMLSVFEEIPQMSSLSLSTKDFWMWHKRRMRSLLAALSLLQRATRSATAKEKINIFVCNESNFLQTVKYSQGSSRSTRLATSDSLKYERHRSVYVFKQ